MKPERKLFVGVMFNGAAREKIVRVRKVLEDAHLGECGYMVRTKSLHITLAFLGAIPDMWIPHVCAVMRTVGEEQRQFSISMHGLRIFENERPVVWVGVRSSELSILRRDLIKKLRGVGIPVQGNKVWNPHITMGKIFTRRATLTQEWNEKMVRSAIKKHEACEFGSIEYAPLVFTRGCWRQEINRIDNYAMCS